MRKFFTVLLVVCLAAVLGVGIAYATTVKSGVKHAGNAAKSSQSLASDPVLIGTTTLESFTDSNANQPQAWQYTATTSGTTTDAEIYDAKGTAKITVGLYANTSSNKPGKLLAVGSLSKSVVGWDNVTVGSAAVVAGTKYWLAFQGNDSFRDAGAGASCSTVGSTGNIGAVGSSWTTAWTDNGYCPASFYVNGTTGTTTSTTTTTTPTTTTTTTTSTTSTTTTTPPPPPPGCSGSDVPGGADPWGGCFPGPNNTGVPAGTSLTTISSGQSGTGWKDSGGELDITQCGVTLNAVKIGVNVIVESTASNGTHSASTPCVTITNSEIDGFVQVSNTSGDSVGGPLILTNDTVNTPNADDDRSPVLSANYFATGLNVEGARLGFSCQGGPCSVTDSYAHAGFLEGEFHYNAFGSNGASGMTITHDTLACDFSNTDQTAINNGAGCSDDVGLFPDFAPIQNVSISRNLFVSDAQAFGGVPFCIDAGYGTTKPFVNQTSNISVTNNVFQRGTPPGNGGTNQCGLFGPIYNWPSPTPAGSTWSGNTWDDGTALNAG